MADYVATNTAPYITDESDSALTNENGDALTVEQGTTPLTLTGFGNLTTTSAAASSGRVSVSLIGSGTLQTQAKVTVLAPVAFTGNGILSTTLPSRQTATGTAKLTGTGSLSINGGRLTFANVYLNGNGALNLSVSIQFPASVALYGKGDLSTTPTFTTWIETTNLQGSGSLNAYGRGSEIGVPAPNVLAIQNNKNITGYSVEENATPINAASTEGGVGTIQFGYPQRDNWLMLFEQDVQLSDDFRGVTSGKISAMSAENGILSLTADNRLVTLVGDTRAVPMTGTFESVARYYLRLGKIADGIYFHSDVKDIPVTVQGWAGDAWLNLKQLCTAYNVEVSLVSNNVTFRPIRSVETNFRKLTAFNETITSSDIARSIEVNYYTNYWYDNTLVYPRTIDEVTNQQVFQVDANSIIEDDIPLSASLETLLQPICVTDVAEEYDGNQSVYSVRGIDNSQVTPQQWYASGGNIELSINDDTTSVHIKITGPRDEYYSPYRICGRVKEVTDVTKIIVPPGSPPLNDDDNKQASKGSAKTKPQKETDKEKAARLKKEAQEKAKAAYDAMMAANKLFADPAASEQDYASLRIVGTGTHIDKNTLTLPTGVPEVRTAADIGASVESVYVSALEDAYRVGVQVAAAYRGEEHTITATLSQINQRMGSGSILYRTVGDIESQYRGMTIGDFKQVWTGKTIADFNVAQKALIVDNYDNQVFGNVPGTRFLHNDAMFRIIDATTTESDIQISATRDTMMRDFETAHANETIAVFNKIYAGKTLKEFGRIPLLGGN